MMRMLFPLIILISLFDLDIAFKLNNGVINSIAGNNLNEFIREFDQSIKILAFIDIVIATTMIVVVAFLIKNKQMHGIAVLGVLLVVSPIASDGNYHLTAKILDSNSLSLRGIKTRVFLYKYYKLKGDNKGVNVVLKDGLAHLDKDDLYVLIKNRKSNKNFLFTFDNDKK